MARHILLEEAPPEQDLGGIEMAVPVAGQFVGQTFYGMDFYGLHDFYGLEGYMVFPDGRIIKMDDLGEEAGTADAAEEGTDGAEEGTAGTVANGLELTRRVTD